VPPSPIFRAFACSATAPKNFCAMRPPDNATQCLLPARFAAAISSSHALATACASLPAVAKEIRSKLFIQLGRDGVSPSQIFWVLPRQNIHPSLKRPIVRLFHQSRADRIFADIIPFLRVIFTASQARVPEIPLPFTGFRQMETTEFPFPIRDPALQRDRQISRCAKQVDVIRYEQIIAYEPGIRLRPDFAERVVDIWLRKPRLTVFGANGQKNNGWLLGRN